MIQFLFLLFISINYQMHSSYDKNLPLYSINENSTLVHQATSNDDLCLCYTQANPTNISQKNLYYEDPFYQNYQPSQTQEKKFNFRRDCKCCCFGCISSSTLLSIIGILVFQHP